MPDQRAVSAAAHPRTERVPTKSGSTTTEKRRSELVCRTMYELLGAIDSLEVYGLSLNTATLNVEAVEQVLMTDVWQCPRCGETHEAGVCPHTGKPHRRRLVRVAQSILYLIGLRVGRIHLQPAHLTERMDGRVQMRVQRRIAINPQLLLLAFYFAAMKPSGGSRVSSMTSPTAASATAAQERNSHHARDKHAVHSTHAHEITIDAKIPHPESVPEEDGGPAMTAGADHSDPERSRSRSHSNSRSTSRHSSQQSVHKRRRTLTQDAHAKNRTSTDEAEKKVVRADGDGDNDVTMERLTMECAQQLIDLLRQIRNYSRASVTAAAASCALASSTMMSSSSSGGGGDDGGCGRIDASYALSLMRSFRSAWEQYLLYVDDGSHASNASASSAAMAGCASCDGPDAAIMQPQSQQQHEYQAILMNPNTTSAPGSDTAPATVSWMSPMDRRAAAAELLVGTREALLAVARQLAHDPDNATLSDFAVLLYQRMKRLAGAEELAQVDAELERVRLASVAGKERANTDEEDDTAEENHEAKQPRSQDDDDYERAEVNEEHARKQHGDELQHDARNEDVHEKQRQHSQISSQDATPPFSALSLSAGAHSKPSITSAVATAQPQAAILPPSSTSRPAATLLLPSDAGNTTASEDEHDTVAPATMPLAAQIAAVVEPALPPDWTVDAEGRSRPPPDTAQRRRREVFARMEFKARRAYEAVFAPSTSTPLQHAPGDSRRRSKSRNLSCVAENEAPRGDYSDDEKQKEGGKSHMDSSRDSTHRDISINDNDDNMDGNISDDARSNGNFLGAALEAHLATLRRQLSQHPTPDTHGIPALLRLVEQELLRSVPARVQRAVAQELRDTLDYCGSVVMGQSMKSCSNSTINKSETSSSSSPMMMNVVVNTVRFVAGRIAYWGAPAMAASVEQEAERVCAALQNRIQDDMPRAVTRAFRFLFVAIRRLQHDVARYSLSSITALLRVNSVDFIRDFVLNCLPPPADWTSTLAFLRTALGSASFYSSSTAPSSATVDSAYSSTAAMGISTSVASTANTVNTRSTAPVAATDYSVTALSPAESALRTGMIRATMDLLRSGGRTTATRWVNLPAEGFYFEKIVLFRIANAVQECTLLLLLEGTVSSILSSHGMRHAPRAAMLKQLHTDILALLARDIHLDTLHRAVVDFLDRRLGSSDILAMPTSTKASASPSSASLSTSSLTIPTTALTAVEEDMIRTMIGKMTNTEDALYMAFERKVLGAMERVVCQEQNIPPLGLVTETVRQHGGTLRKMLDFNWEVYAPFYREIIPLLING